MYFDRSATEGETPRERRAADQPASRVLGHIVQCDGARAVIATTIPQGETPLASTWTVGKLISIDVGHTRTVGLIYAIERPQRRWDEDNSNPLTILVELIGEVSDRNGTPVFDRGITNYPHIGAPAHRIRAHDLKAVYDLGGERHSVAIGHLSQDESIEACLAVNETLSRHFAVVGTTGVGKSTAVSLLLRKMIASRSDLRVLILDPHNEFAPSLPEYCVRIDTASLDLPFWLFRLEELVEVLYRGREPVAEEVELLRDLIAQAKHHYGSHGSLLRRGGDNQGITADTPVPYRMADVLDGIDERLGQLDAKDERVHLRQLRARVESALADPRYRFMFASRLIEDSIQETVGRIFRIPSEGRPVTCFEMAGLPSEVVNSVCSVLSRLAFDLALWGEGKLKLLLMCEEAHRYMPADPQLGFAPTRHALARIAKEGRKYGCYLGVVTQRPGDLDPTVLSQCSTIFAMRLANEQDQAIIRSAIADSSASTLAFLSAMGQREAIAFGDGVATTMRMKFEALPDKLLPGAKDSSGTMQLLQAEEIDDVDLAAIIERMRDSGKRTRTASSAFKTDASHGSVRGRNGEDTSPRRHQFLR